MSSNNNGEFYGIFLVLTLIMTAAMILGIAVALVVSFLSIIFTVISILAWDEPFRIGNWVYTPHQARWFIYRGLHGAWLLPAFVGFSSVWLDFSMTIDAWLFSMLVGYVLGSAGIEFFFETDAPVDNVPLGHAAETEEVTEREALPPPEKPFSFASWDDEEESK